MTKQEPICIHWFRRDLRMDDNHALDLALSSGLPVLPLFIFDRAILNGLPKKDARVEFIVSALGDLNDLAMKHNSSVLMEDGEVVSVFEKILAKWNVRKVFANEDYEPAAIARDSQVAKLLESKGAELILYKDQVIFHKDECVKPDGKPYSVFTPYSRKWKELYRKNPAKPFQSEKKLGKLLNFQSSPKSLKQIGFEESGIEIPPCKINLAILKKYAQERNNLEDDSTTKLGIHFRFGTMSIREAVSAAKLYPVWLNELIWREFFMMILFHYPETVTKPARDLGIKWRKSESDFKKWRDGQTGYPLVDAAMRDLNQTGRMPNRARMVAGSFLTKHLLIHWKEGERYFAEKLLDFELASNVGNWQWVAGTGYDAAPYFRIFNPEIAAKKFDPQGQYVKKWIPEINTPNYPEPMIEHKVARDRALEAYHEARKRKTK